MLEAKNKSFALFVFKNTLAFESLLKDLDVYRDSIDDESQGCQLIRELVAAVPQRRLGTSRASHHPNAGSQRWLISAPKISKCLCLHL